MHPPEPAAASPHPHLAGPGGGARSPESGPLSLQPLAAGPNPKRGWLTFGPHPPPRAGRCCHGRASCDRGGLDRRTSPLARGPGYVRGTNGGDPPGRAPGRLTPRTCSAGNQSDSPRPLPGILGGARWSPGTPFIRSAPSPHHRVWMVPMAVPLLTADRTAFTCPLPFGGNPRRRPPHLDGPGRRTPGCMGQGAPAEMNLTGDGLRPPGGRRGAGTSAGYTPTGPR
jgi:hypothetical protein